MSIPLSVFKNNFGMPGQAWLRYIEAWNSHCIPDVLACVSHNFLYDECPMTMEEPIKGKDGFQVYLENIFQLIPDIRIELRTLEEGTTTCWSESIMTGTFVKQFLLFPTFSRKMITKVACAFTVQHGLIKEERLYWDKGNTLRQFGTLASLFGLISKPAWSPR